MLLDRDAERAALDRLLAEVRDGSSRALVVRGEPGIGKTALLAYAVEAAPDLGLARVVGVESEMELAFAALHQLLLPFLASFEQLPVPRREALGSAFGLLAGPPPDRFLVGLAALTLLTEAALKRPVLCVVDDAQWVDQASLDALGFVARRLFADRVGMVFGVREGDKRLAGLQGLPELTVEGLPDEAASGLLAEVAGGQLDQAVARRIVNGTLGNPLALVELGGELSADELSGAAPLLDPLRLGEQLEQVFRRRASALPAPTQTLLLLAAAEPSGDAGMLWRAAAQLGVERDAAEAPGLARILRLTPRVTFRHPLVRSAVYHGASDRARRDAHQALAAASDPELDPDRRAWHLGTAARGPDEGVAAELERSANHARSRGGWAACAAFLERAAQLTPDPGRRAQRSLAAAETKFIAGDSGAARILLEGAAPQLADSLSSAQARRLEGNIRFAERPAEAAAILLHAFEALQPLDLRLARDTLLDAFQAATIAGTMATGANLADVLGAVRVAPNVGSQATAGDFLLDGFALLAEGEDEAGVRRLRHAIDLYIADEALSRDAQSFAMVDYAASRELLDDALWHAVSAHAVEEARKAGALGVLAVALPRHAIYELSTGRFAAADVALEEARELAAATGTTVALSQHSRAVVNALAWRGREAEAREAAATVVRVTTDHGMGAIARYAHMALALLQLGLGNYEAALRYAQLAYEGFARESSDLIEAAVRCGEREVATSALAELSRRARASGSDWALGLLLRSQALLAGDPDAESLYRGAIEHLGRCRIVPELARAHLLYGEWLRRQRRRRDAREQLRTAYETFDRLGAEAFAERARVELLATGERVRKRSVETRAELTPQEQQVARLASEGASNQEIASQLFISTSTVAYHLTKVFEKLEVPRRTALAQALNQQR